CHLAAGTQAQSHLQARDYALRQPNLRGIDWWQATAPAVLPFLSAEQAGLLRSELEHQQAFYAGTLHASLQAGAVHCDLFRDNVLFAGTAEQPLMGGFIDFYFAGCDTWLFDVAVAVNDWCIERD